MGALVVVAIAAGIALFAFLGRNDPKATADTFLGALESKDFTAAHDALCKDGKSKEPPDALKTDFRLDDNSITGYSIVSTTKSTKDSNATAVRATLTYSTGDKVDVELEVVAEGGGKICGFTVPA